MDLAGISLHGYGGYLLSGAGVTLCLSLVSIPLGVVISLFAYGLLRSRWAIFRAFGRLYVDLFRALPEILIVFLLFYGLDAAINALLELVFGTVANLTISPFVAGVLSLALVFGAYGAEVFRGARSGVPVGSVEAGVAVGMTAFQVFHRVTLPQLWRLSLPALGNLSMILIKNTALVSVIFLNELLRNAQLAGRATDDPFPMLLCAVAMYLVIAALCSGVFRYLERRSTSRISSEIGRAW